MTIVLMRLAAVLAAAAAGIYAAAGAHALIDRFRQP